jgi:putative PIN family toxin of toxin-antitoxin system
MLVELADVLSRDKFNVTGSQVDRFVSSLVRMSKMVPNGARFKVLSEDPDDDIVLNTAYSGRVEFIVTGDQHLLALSQFKKTKIVNVTQMQDILKEKQTLRLKKKA